MWVGSPDLPVECLRTLSPPLSREPFRSPRDREDFISLCLSLVFTCRYCRRSRMLRRVGEERRGGEERRR